MTQAPTLELVVQSPTSAALDANGYPCLTEARVTAPNGVGATTLRIGLAGVTPAPVPYETTLEPLRAGETLAVSLREFCLPLSLLTGRTERTTVELVAQLVDASGALLATTGARVVIQPSTHWDPTWAGVESLAAFVTPNAPQLAERLSDASRRLGARTGNESIDGYQSGSAERAQRIAEACCEALAASVQNYTEGRTSFEGAGQRVRLAGEVLAESMGNCLDLACAVAALLELAGLHPLLVLGEGHAIAGFFTGEEHFPEPVHMGTSRVRNRLELGELRVLDATALAGSNASFGRALETGERWLAERGEQIWVVDIKAARAAKVRPLPDQLNALGVREALRREPLNIEWKPKLPVHLAPPKRVERTYREQRLALWRKRLLDLTLRNRLLNDPFEKKGLPLLAQGDDALALLEDELWNERKLRLLPSQPGAKALDIEAVRAELKKGWLSVAVSEAELYTRSTKAFRDGRSSVEETGARSLYVAIGFLRYRVEGRPTDLLAPLLLVPIELERISRAEGYRVVPLTDDTVTNAALSEFLKQTRGIDLGLEDTLPEDEQGVHVQALLARVRHAVREQPGMTVEARAKIGTWAFKKLPLVEELRLRADALSQHPLVATLLERNASAAAREALPKPEDVEQMAPRAELRLPLAADSSQVAAIVAATKGHTFVLQGPPGTGKSQTITNLLSEALSRGKRVLFLAEKSAALDVVAKRLERTGLGVYALNLHPEQATKAGFVAQVKAGLDNLDASAAAHSRRFVEKGQALDEAVRQLARVKELLHAAADGDVSLHEAVDAAVCARAALGGLAPKLEGALAVPLHRTQLAEVEERGRRLGLAWQQVPRESAGLLFDLDCRAPLAAERENEAAESLTRLATALQRALDTSKDLAGRLGVAAPVDAASAARLASLATFLGTDHATTAPLAAALCGASANTAFETLDVALRLEATAQGERARAEQLFERDALSLQASALLGELRASREQFFVSAWFTRRRIRKQLVPLARTMLPTDVDGLSAAVQALVDARAALEAVAPHANTLAQLRGPAPVLDVADARRRLEAARELHASLRAGDPNLAPSLAPRLGALCGSAELAASSSAVAQALSALEPLRNQLISALSIGSAIARPFAAELECCQRWLSRSSDWDVWSTYAAERFVARERGLAPLAAALERSAMPAGKAELAALSGALDAWLEFRLRRELELATTSGEQVEELRRKLSVRLREYGEGVADAVDTVARDRAKKALADAERDPTLSGQLRELRKLQTLTTVRRSLRRLMRETGRLLIELKPIVLASPLSAASHLPPDFPEFDLVVIDEASQVPVWDAACALSRAREAVVVGDSRQLPPTSFFDRREEEDEGDEEAEEVESVESVLDGCVNAGLPQLSLLWHYRSRDERLIEFANRRSYGARLQTFPAPHVAHPNLGVEFRLVPGVYDRSGSRTNRIEAESVVAEIVRRLSDSDGCTANRSIGVVTFSVAQQELVRDLLDAALDSNAAAAAAASGDPVFVKNLENVQGDERATMLFSVGYGPDAQGRIHYNFGPLTASGGERRLNVAITRAREKVIVFASMRAAQLDPAKCRAQGVGDLRSYLEYAERGVLPAIDGDSGSRKPIGITGVERDLAARLEQRGWKVTTHVGRSRDYRISLALADARDPSRFVLGVELDGAHWASAPTTFDRELVRTGVLAGLGWKVIRLSALDAWRQPELAAERIDAEARKSAGG
ncbi:MAG: DUF4011 domain-containing protein [Planctomycetota bacterium]|nr:DUF4011 domain-containing protein [Planctomycetota bacterium]